MSIKDDASENVDYTSQQEQDDEEEDYDDDQNYYEYDEFVVPDEQSEEESDQPEQEAPKSKRRKRIRRKDLDDDVELINENLRGIDAYEDDQSEIDGLESVMSGGDDYDNQNYQHYQTSLATKIFGAQQPEEQQEQPEQDQFDPGEQKQHFVTEEDKEVRDKDVPERLQKYLKGRDNPLDDEIKMEAQWFLVKLQVESLDLDIEKLVQKIEKFLILYRVKLYEVPYIKTYHMHKLTPEIDRESILYDFAKWDLEWGSLYESKNHYLQLLHSAQQNAIALANGEEIDPGSKVLISYDETKIPEEVIQLISSYSMSSYRYELSDLYKFVQVLTYSYYPQDYPVRNYDSLLEARKEKLNEFAEQAAINPLQFSMNIKEKQQLFIPSSPNISPADLAFEYLGQYQNTNKILNAVKHLMSSEISAFPSFRQYVREEYQKYVRIFTQPTEKGKQELTVFHPFYRVKQLQGKQLSTISDTIWIEISECESQGLIQVQFKFTWTTNEEDRILAYLCQLYCFGNQEEETDQEWNFFRAEIIKSALNETYKEIEDDIRKELAIQGEQIILKQCQEKFVKMITKPVYKPTEKVKLLAITENEEEYSKPKVMSIICSPNDYQGGCSIVLLDRNGETVEVAQFLKLLDRRPENLKDQQKQIYLNEKQKFVGLILSFYPDAIVIGANCLQAITAKQIIFGFLDLLTEQGFVESKFEWQIDRNQLLLNRPLIALENMEVPQLFANSRRSIRLQPELNTPLRQAVSLGRCFQNPLAEILELWADPLEIKIAQLNLHPLQRFISEQRLLQCLEMATSDVVCDQGVNITLIKDHLHLSTVLPFVAGLGQAKAHYLLEGINTRLHGKIQLRAKLYLKRIIGPKVYENCAGFLYIPISENETDPLDSTRIHPKQYHLTNQIAASALEVEITNLEDQHWLVPKVMRNPQSMQDLDIEEYSKMLQQYKSYDIKPVLQFIIRELTFPYRFYPRSEDLSYQEPESQKIFYFCTGETPQTLRKGSIVQGKVINFDDKRRTLTVRLECGVIATVDQQNIVPHGELVTEDMIKLAKGNTVTGRVIELMTKSSDRDVFFRVKLSLLQDDIVNHDRFLERDLDEAFVIDQSDWIEQAIVEDEAKQGQKYVPRVVNHPYFRNIDYRTCIQELHNKYIGDCIIRPSSRGQDHLTLSWKFFDGVYAHVDILEKYKPSNNMLGAQFVIGDDVYVSLQEIIDTYVKPCEKLTKQAIHHQKFIDSSQGGLKYLENKLRQDKMKEPKTIPYNFTIVPQFPQFLILCYIPKDKIIQEYIKIKPRGLFFHECYHPNMNSLISWFKRHQSDRQYQSHLARVRPPDFDTSVHYAIPKKLDRPMTPRRDFVPQKGNQTPVDNATPYTKTPQVSGREWGKSTSTPRADDPDRYFGRDDRGWDAPPDQDKKRGRRKERTCHKCGKEGHFARECKVRDQKRSCFNCGEDGHIARDCPNPVKRSRREESKRSEQKRDEPANWEQNMQEGWGDLGEDEEINNEGGWG